MSGPQAAMLPDGRRLHLHHGPIDLIVEAFGPEDERRAALAQAAARMEGLLEGLAAELPALRAPAGEAPLHGPVARRMGAAVGRHSGFVTPMAAVAGAVADEVLAALLAGRRLSRAYVNNGGDVALHLAEGEAFSIALWDQGDAGRARLRARDAARGVATSGWRGRSLSLGVADAVTVLARDAAAADVAATLIANAVDLPGHPAIRRGPACEEDPDSDLGARPVTLAVGPLGGEDARAALAAGRVRAEAMRAAGLIEAAALFLQGEACAVGPLAVQAQAGRQAGASAGAQAGAVGGGGGRRRGRARARRGNAMAEFHIRRTALIVEDIFHEGGPRAPEPRRRGAMLAVVSNPFAGRYAPELQSAMEDLKPLGAMMAERLIAGLGGAEGIDAYGKGAIVGEGGEIEHGALWHVPGGYAMRGLIKPSNAIVPSAMKVGGMGARLDVPLGHVNAAYVRSHFDAMEVGLSDGPRAGEILFALVMGRGGRVHARMGGLSAEEATGEDGLR